MERGWWRRLEWEGGTGGGAGWGELERQEGGWAGGGSYQNYGYNEKMGAGGYQQQQCGYQQYGNAYQQAYNYRGFVSGFDAGGGMGTMQYGAGGMGGNHSHNMAGSQQSFGGLEKYFQSGGGAAGGGGGGGMKEDLKRGMKMKTDFAAMMAARQKKMSEAEDADEGMYFQ
jgi:hypothetical protein